MLLSRTIPSRSSISDGGVVTTDDVARILRDRLGPLTDVRFTMALQHQRAVCWKARDPDNRLVSGWLVLHAGLRGDDQVMAWAEILVDERAQSQRVAAKAGDAERRLDLVALRARHLISRIREEPTCGAKEIVAALVGMVDVAEGGADL